MYVNCCHNLKSIRYLMKFIYCPICDDVFKLVVAQPRSCICGSARGQLEDHSLARTNGKGISVVIGNGSLAQAITKMQNIKQDGSNEFYVEQTPVICWVRPHAGPGNPRTRIEQEGDAPLGSSVKLLYQAVKHYRQQHTASQAIPNWVAEAERLLARIQGR